MTLYCLNNTFKLIKIETVMHQCQLAVNGQTQRHVGWRLCKEQAGACKQTVLFRVTVPNLEASWPVLFHSLLSEDNTCLVICPDYHLWKVVEVRGGLWQMEEGKCCSHFQKRARERSRELNIKQSHFGPWENHGVSPLRANFCTHEGE